MTTAGRPHEPFEQFLLTYTEVSALTAVLSAACQQVERQPQLGMNSHAWILLNSLRTAFAEAGWRMDPASTPEDLIALMQLGPTHPCRGCDQRFEDHPVAGCDGWH